MSIRQSTRVREMKAASSRLPPTGVSLLAVACLAAAPADIVSSDPVPLAVKNGRCTFVLPTSSARDKYLLVVGSLSRDRMSHRVCIRAEATSDAVSLPLANDDPGVSWRKHTAELADRLEKARKARRLTEDYPPAAEPPRHRDFVVFADSGNCSSVRGELRGIGQHCLVYVEQDYPTPAALQPAVDDVIQTFDNAVFPTARKEQGRCLDVDRDGRFTVLFSSRLSRVGGGKGALSGFVLGSDFYRDVPVPFGNRCDMLYLSTDLRPGPFLRTLVAHEYTHAVAFSEHIFGDYLPGVRHLEEESWLNEGVAHLVEERHGFGWGNLDYRVSTFLSAPRRYPLVVSDYFGSGLWRDPGCRGATYLFLHACSRDDPRLAQKLIQSNLIGIANLEAATRAPFAALFRQWTLALALGKVPDGHDLFRPLGERKLCGARHDDVPLSGGKWTGDIAGTAAAYFQLNSPGPGSSRVTIESDDDADLQVTLLPLAPDTPRLSLTAESPGPGVYRLTVTARDGSVILREAGWEWTSLDGSTAGKYSVADPTSVSSAAVWFGDPALAEGETRASTTIEMPPGQVGSRIFRVSGRDGNGRRVSAWAEVPAR
jgi:hypothetical protein